MSRRAWTSLALLAILLGFAALHLAGARAYVGVLSGTLPGAEHELAIGVVYVLAWFAAVLVVPTVAIALAADRACGMIASRLHQWRASRRP